MQGQPLTTIVVCHRNRVLVGLGKLQAERHGLRVFVASNGNDVLAQARRHAPELIVLSNDLKNPSTEETIQMLRADPSLAGTRVVTIKGALPPIKDLLLKPGV
jgi:CheY-like chemotaxis protein